MFTSDKERSGGLPCPEVLDVSLIISKVLKDSLLFLGIVASPLEAPSFGSQSLGDTPGCFQSSFPQRWTSIYR